MKKRLLIIVLVILSAVFVQTSAWAGENAAAYLQEYYGIAFEGDVSAADFNAALTALGTDPLETDTLTLTDAAMGAIRLAGMEELALLYGSDNFPVNAADDSLDPYAACALDQELIDSDEDLTGPVSAETAAELLYRAAEIAGKGRHYIGRISDEGLPANLRSLLDSVFIFDDEVLNTAGIDILISEATTGYSLKYAGYDARFLEEYTLRYGHDDPDHLMQLIALMKAAGFDAYVQIEPKVSVYEYMPEWGLPDEPTPTYEVVEMMEGRYFAFAMEYDMTMEFDSAEEKEAFHGLVENYAKKYDDSFDEEGNLVKPLLLDSWWQPLYYSTTAMENDEFMALTDNVITADESGFSIHSFSLPENAGAIAAAAEQSDPELTTETRTIYVNPAFYRYITDTDHQ